MIFQKQLISIAFAISCSFSWSQEEYTFNSPCFSVSTDMFISSEDDAYIAVYEYCTQNDFRLIICHPENGELVNMFGFEMEVSRGFYAVDGGFYLLTKAPEAMYLRFISDDLEVSDPISMQLPLSASVNEMFVHEDSVIVVYYNASAFYISKLGINDGELIELASFSGVPYVSDIHSTTVLADENSVYFGMDCGWIFKVNLNEFLEVELLPLPIDDSTGNTYLPCFGGFNLLRSNPSEDVLLSAASTAFTDNYYSFDFGDNGDHIQTDYLTLPNYSPGDFTFDQNGNKYLTLLKGADPDVFDYNIFGLYHINSQNEVVDSLFLDSPEWLQGGYEIILNNQTIHLNGVKYHLENPELEVASYIRVQMSDFVNSITELNDSEELKIIQTDEIFGLSNFKGAITIALYDLKGNLLQFENQPILWRKADFMSGVYVLSVNAENKFIRVLIFIP
ncbi:MAG: hypothetical protein GC193_04420 [Cryomorphaceae bacterium]|nr:hypothetical protein [Cryomorphaceae bacterium]